MSVSSTHSRRDLAVYSFITIALVAAIASVGSLALAHAQTNSTTTTSASTTNTQSGQSSTDVSSTGNCPSMWSGPRTSNSSSSGTSS